MKERKAAVLNLDVGESLIRATDGIVYYEVDFGPPYPISEEELEVLAQRYDELTSTIRGLVKPEDD